MLRERGGSLVNSRLRFRVAIHRTVLACLAFLLAAIALIAACIGIESRYVFAPSRSRAMETVRAAVTRPVAAAVGWQLQQKMRAFSNARMRIVSGDSTIQQNIDGLLDGHISPQRRQIFAQRLARTGTPEAFAALLRAFRNASPDEKPFFAQLLGTADPASKDTLLPLLADQDDELASAAIRGLAAIGGQDVTAKLAAVLDDAGRTKKIRLAAAGAMAEIGTSEACDDLIRAFPAFAQTDGATELLGSLGHFPFEEINATFRDFLAAPETPREMRVVAVEALADSTTEAVPFLFEVVKDDSAAEVRASAAWAISAHGFAGFGLKLTELVTSEPDVNVRRRLYEALTVQSDPRGAELLPRVLAETDIATRIAGFNALAVAAALDPTAQVATTFDQQIIPELERLATSQNSVNLGLRAVFALRRSGSEAAQRALAAIANLAGQPDVSAAAQRGLLSSTK
jgi:HEAT repeat protein